MEPASPVKIDTAISLAVVLGLLVSAVIASILRPAPDARTLDASKVGE